MDIALIIEWVIKSVVILVICIGGFAYLTLFERRVLARMQIRIGPNRAGPWGILQPVADGIKLIFNEELRSWERIRGRAAFERPCISDGL